MNKLICTLLLFLSLTVSAQYKVEIDLNNIIDDQVPVMIYPPKTSDSTIEYHMVKIVPGTYSISDYGRFVSDFKAIANNGEELGFEKLSTNRWKINNAQELNYISYKVHDTFDAFEGYGEERETIIFEPGGTGIDVERNVYAFNTFGFIGYVKGQIFQPYELKIKHPENLFGGTALENKSRSETEDVFVAEDYNFLADGPIMYCKPDTVTKQLAGAEILVSVYSPNNVLSAKDVMDNIGNLMEAQANYLGGKLPVDRYAYLIYLMDGSSLSGAMGALEHSYSSFYSLPEANAERIGQTVRDVAAHEFLHIVTPLNIHSEQIGQFNYIEPDMSKHLWLYEGVTEYSAMHVQVKYGLYGPEKFLEEITDKLRRAERYPSDVSFTEMSKKILEDAYAPLYGNVYQKGALIGMCLDLYLLKYSDGTYDLPQLMQDLSLKYGKTTSFKDDDLFDIITEMTYPEVGEFFTKYVDGNEPLPVKKVLDWAGVNYEESVTTMEFSLGQISLNLNENREIIVADISGMNKFGKALGYQTGDVISSINGENFTLATAQGIITNFGSTFEEGDKVTVVVKRDKKGKMKKKKLKAKAFKVERTQNHFLQFNSNPTDDQMSILKAWIVAK
ncbi:MAG: peptidase M61 [Cyclobacteriaceae bacterium]